MPVTTLTRDFPSVSTPDGAADSYFSHPSSGPGPWPAVLVFMDAFGLRPQLERMADTLAERGYAVLVPNLLYRAGPAPVIPDVVARLQSPDERAAVYAELTPLMRSLTPEALERDTSAYVAFLDAQPTVAPGSLAVVGYCMGAAMCLRAAAQLPERVVGAALFHGSRLAPDQGGGPHELAPRIRAEVYAAHADGDPSLPADQIARLEQSLQAAGVRHTCEVYAGSTHGFTMADTAAYDATADARHRAALLALLSRTLPAG
jgi:carboxymethylenebutenolidase